MFLFIPMIIIFLLLSFSYLYEVSSFVQGLIYSVCIFVGFISFSIYQKIKKDIKQQEINRLKGDLKTLEQQLEVEEDKRVKNTLYLKINSIKKEIEAK